jgi:hypothetical protein
MMPYEAIQNAIPSGWRYANTGGPHSRTRKQTIETTLLGRETGQVRCPKVRVLGLKFDPDSSAVDAVQALLRSVGLDAPDTLRNAFELPAMAMMVRPVKSDHLRLCTVAADPMQVLEQALWLGLCTAYLFDARRPVIWTEVSLRRSLELFEPAGFYA